MGFELAWDDAGASYALHVLDPNAVRHLQSHPRFAASSDVQTLLRARSRRSVGRALGLTAIAAFVLLPLILILIFIWQADRLAAAFVDRIPIEQEKRLGSAAFDSLRPSLTLIEEGGSPAAVRSLGERLASGSRYTYQFHVAQDDSINAFALPGGIIVVHTGLIEATRRPEELAGVLAHEIQHVEQRHSLRGAIKNLGLRGLWAFVTGDLGGTLAGQAALELTSRKFSREDESEADAGAFDLLVRERIDPSAMADFFATMRERASTEVPEILSTHPASDERKRRLDELSKQRTNPFEPLVVEKWPP
jgi:predicted Zn-dependent protease